MHIASRNASTTKPATLLVFFVKKTAYMDQLKTDHQQAISLYQGEVQNGSDPQLKSFAQSTLPSLRKRQQMTNRPTKRM